MGLINSAFRGLGAFLKKRVEKSLEKDPENQKLDEEMKQLRKKIEDTKSKYPKDSIVHLS